MSKRKAPGSERASSSSEDAEKSVNERIAAFLFELANYEKNVNRDTFRSNAYRKAAIAVQNCKEPITSGKQASKLDGVGKKIAEKIDEFLRTGKLQKLETIRADDASQAINELTRVAGIGPAKARELFDQGITSVEMLHKHPDKLNNAQKIGLKHFADFEKRIPRAEIEEIEEVLQEELSKLDKRFTGTICGSYRRGAETSGDIDLLLTHDEFTSKTSHNGSHLLKDVVEALKKRKLVTDTISLGDSKFMGVCKLDDSADRVYRRLDIRLLPKDQYFCGILFSTGSDMFNRNMRQHALDRGFTLNEYTLRPVGKDGQPGEPLPVSSEEDIFDYISYEYKAPEDRSV